MAEEETLSVEDSEMLQQVQGAKLGAGEAEPLDPDDVMDVEGEAVVEPETGDEIQIGDKVFATQDEALAYARDLQESGETEKLLHDAYRQGINDAGIGAPAAPGVTQSPVEEEDNFDEKFFENPKEYLKSFADKIRTEVKGEIGKESAQARADAELWSEFYGKNPDLAGFEDDCQAVLAREAAMIETLVKTSGKEKAMDYLARKTRKKFQDYSERQRPSTELASNAAGATPSGGARVTQAEGKTSEGPVDFVTQMKQHKRALENRS